jgi:DMSO/TMAO reductase YedYZ molybdopterin-dependent catalytic subunit
MIDRRTLLATAGLAAPALAAEVDLRLPGGPSQRPLTDAFPGKRGMILQRTSQPLLETPLDAFNEGVFTPNDRFFVRWHWPFPTEIDVAAHRLTIDGHVKAPVSLSLAELKALPQFEINAINQCSGNSRGLFEPRVTGAQWAHGAMGNARWTGVRLRDVIAKVGLKPGAVALRFSGLDTPLVEEAPDFAKSLGVDHALNGEVMIAWAMNGEALPILNGFPLRLVVPGWYSTYWVKMLDRIEVLDRPDDGYWMAKAYLVPDTPDGGVPPETKDFPKRPISKMVPRSFITSHAEGAVVPWAEKLMIGGIAMGGDCGVKAVEVSADGGKNWQAAVLGADHGPYSFRRFDAAVTPARGDAVLMARATNTKGVTQPPTGLWNPSGFMRTQVEPVPVRFA